MTRWQFDDGSSVETVADNNRSVTYAVSSLSTDHTGVYYCEAIIDGMTNTSMNYTLFGKYRAFLYHTYVTDHYPSTLNIHTYIAMYVVS